MSGDCPAPPSRRAMLHGLLRLRKAVRYYRVSGRHHPDYPMIEPSGGICHNLLLFIDSGRSLAATITGELQRVFEDVMLLDRHYPVPAVTKGYTAADEYVNAVDCWRGEYGALRMQLLNALIDYYNLRGAAWTD